MSNVVFKSAPSPSLTRVRYGVLAFACGLSMITYLDRACMGSAAKAFVHELHLNSVGELNWVFVAFTVAYALFTIPGGWLGDVFGPRRVLVPIVLWWSACTALTGLIGLSMGGRVFGSFQVGAFVMTPLATLIVVRFVFGMGEAGAYPNITRALHNWLPLRERGFAQGCVWMCGRLMAGVTPLVWMALVEGIGRPLAGQSTAAIGQPLVPPLLSWRSTFWLFATVGFVWCVLFAIWFRNRPEEKRGVGRAELELIGSGRVESQTARAGGPWLRLLGSGNLWLLCLMYACQSYGWAFYMTYLPSFLEDHYGVEAHSTLGAIYKGGPLWMGALGCLAGGLLTDWFVRRTGNRRWGRRLFGVLGHAIAIGYASILFFGYLRLVPVQPQLPLLRVVHGVHPNLIFWTVVQTGKVTPLVSGPPGCGKSRTIEAFAKAMQRQCYTLIGSLREPADVGGYLRPGQRQGLGCGFAGKGREHEPKARRSENPRSPEDALHDASGYVTAARGKAGAGDNGRG